MSQAKQLTKTVSTKGQVILPEAIRQHWDWGSDTHLERVRLSTANLDS